MGETRRIEAFLRNRLASMVCNLSFPTIVTTWDTATHVAITSNLGQLSQLASHADVLRGSSSERSELGCFPTYEDPP